MKIILLIFFFISVSYADENYVSCQRGTSFKKVDINGWGDHFAYGCDKESKSGDYVYHGLYVETKKIKNGREYIILSGQYINGQREGRWILNGQRTGSSWKYKKGFENYSQGKLKDSKEYILFDNSYGGTEEITFHVENYIHKKGSRIGVKHGEVIVYYGNTIMGKLKSKIKYINGSREGEYVGYFLNGTFAVKGTYKNDKKSGLWTEYYENGRKKNQGNYKVFKAQSGLLHGMQHGEWCMWDEHGKISKSKWIKGNIQGYWE